MKRLTAIPLFAVLCVGAALRTAAQDSFADLKKHFEYGPGVPALSISEVSVQDRDGAKVHDITYASPSGGRVPAYLVVPDGKGRFAAILWAHWLMPNSSSANRSEFLDEAVVLARAGVVSLMIDAPMMRPGFKPNPDLLSGQYAEVEAQEVRDLRRGLDLLLSRADVDPRRVGYVGHSFGANSGAILDAVDKRPTTFVFMANPVSMRDFLTSDLPAMAEYRKQFGDEKIKIYLDKFGWADPYDYAKFLGPAPALFQYATHDEFMTVPMEQKYFDAATGPKDVKFYATTHSLDAKARRDRYEWLKAKLTLGDLPPGALEKVPETK